MHSLENIVENVWITYRNAVRFGIGVYYAPSVILGWNWVINIGLAYGSSIVVKNSKTNISFHYCDVGCVSKVNFTFNSRDSRFNLKNAILLYVRALMHFIFSDDT